MICRSRCISLAHLRIRISQCTRQSIPKYRLSTNSSIPLKSELTRPRDDSPKTNIHLQRLKADPRIKLDSLQDTVEEHRRINHITHSQNVPLKKRDRLARRNLNKPETPGSEHFSNRQSFRRVNLPSSSTQDEEYEGKSIPKTWEWKCSDALPKGVRMPWIQRLQRDASINHNVPAMQRLRDEMQAAQHYLEPTLEEDLVVRQVLADFLQILSRMPDGEKLSYGIVGSRATTAHGPLSDLDLNVKHEHYPQPTQEQIAHILGNIYRFLKYSLRGEVTSSGIVVHSFRHARFPLVECEHLASGLRFQIQYSQNEYDATEITKAYLAEFQALKQIYQIVKQMLDMRGLSNGVRGGITSYPLFHMIVASLKLQSQNKDAASQLLDLFKLYSDIDFYTTAIQYQRDLEPASESHATTGRNFGYDPLSLQPMLVSRDAHRLPYLMSLQDPANLDNNLGRNSTMIKHVQATFMEARERVTAAMKQWDEMYKRGVNMRLHGKPILGWCLEGNYSRFQDQRNRLLSSRAPDEEP